MNQVCETKHCTNFLTPIPQTEKLLAKTIVLYLKKSIKASPVDQKLFCLVQIENSHQPFILFLRNS